MADPDLEIRERPAQKKNTWSCSSLLKKIGLVCFIDLTKIWDWEGWGHGAWNAPGFASETSFIFLNILYNAN